MYLVGVKVGLDNSAIERFRRLEYRPRNQLGAHLGWEAMTPETLQELVGGLAWHLLQKLGVAPGGD